MANEIAARRYATAIFELAREAGAVAPIGADLHAMRDAIYGDAAVTRFFLSPAVDGGDKTRILRESFSSRVAPSAMNALLLLVRKRREALFGEIVRQYDALEVASRGAERLTISSARELSANDLAAIVARLEAIYGRRFDVIQRVDASLLGGLRVTVGDTRIDGSVAGTLERLARTIFTNPPTSRSEHLPT